jgi:hypothetical protein
VAVAGPNVLSPLDAHRDPPPAYRIQARPGTGRWRRLTDELRGEPIDGLRSARHSVSSFVSGL